MSVVVLMERIYHHRPAPNGPHVPKMTQHLLRLNAAKAELFDDASRKRPAVAPPAAQALDSAKRQRTEVATLPVAPGVAPGRQMLTIPKTYADLYTLTTDAALTGFDVQQLPLDIVVQITLATFIAVNTQALDAAVAVCFSVLSCLELTKILTFLPRPSKTVCKLLPPPNPLPK